MVRLVWDDIGDRHYETGVDRGVLFTPNTSGAYDQGVAWNGLTTVTESPSGAESNKQYADNIVYVDLQSAEEFGATIEAFTYPIEWEQHDGSLRSSGGVSVGQQGRKPFGLAYRTLKGNDTEGNDYGYKLHLVYNAKAAPSEKAYGTVNDSPEAITFSWEVTTTPVNVGTVDGVEYKPTSYLVVDSTQVLASELTALENAIWGTAGAEPRLPPPAEVIGMFGNATMTTVATQAPTFDTTTDIITIPTVTGVIYERDGEPVTGQVGPITAPTVITARPADGYQFTATSDTDWTFTP